MTHTRFGLIYVKAVLFHVHFQVTTWPTRGLIYVHIVVDNQLLKIAFMTLCMKAIELMSSELKIFKVNRSHPNLTKYYWIDC